MNTHTPAPSAGATPRTAAEPVTPAHPGAGAKPPRFARWTAQPERTALIVTAAASAGIAVTAIALAATGMRTVAWAVTPVAGSTFVAGVALRHLRGCAYASRRTDTTTAKQTGDYVTTDEWGTHTAHCWAMGWYLLDVFANRCCPPATGIPELS